MFQEGNTVRDLDQGTGPIRLRVHDIPPDEFATGHQRPEPKLTDRIWKSLSAEAGLVAVSEDALGPLMENAVLSRDDFASAVAATLARRLGDRSMARERLEDLAREALADDPAILGTIAADLDAIRQRDPAADGFLTPFLYYKGFHALAWQRISHWQWEGNRKSLAHFLHGAIAETFAVDIHPAVPIGKGVFIDHATGLVVGETAVIGDNVSILHEVTLGGTGKEKGKRHPKVEDGVLLCAGAKVIGNITVGRAAKVGAGSVVLKNVPPGATVVGIPARVVGWSESAVPGLDMDQRLPLNYCI